MKRSVLAVVLLVACSNGGGGDDQPNDLPDASSRPSIDYQAFTTRTRSFGLAGDIHQLSLTDAVGPVACGLSQDHHNTLGTAGHQILINVTPAVGVPCPTGTYAIRSNCSTDFGFGAIYAVPEKCAYYRRFDNMARELGIVAASAGAVQISGDEDACTITVNLSFAGQAYSDSVTLTNGLTSQPWCK